MSWIEGITTIIAAVIAAIIGPMLYSRYLVRLKQEQASRLSYGNRVGIRTCNGKYIMSDLNNSETLFARNRYIGEWETFEIVDATDPFSSIPDRPVRYGDKVAFRAINNGNFVGVDLAHHCELLAHVPHVKAWEVFTLLRPSANARRFDRGVRYGSTFALRAHNRQVVRFNRDGDSSLYADRPHIKEWETFVFIDPTRPK